MLTGLAPFSARLELVVTGVALNCWSESDQQAIREQLDRILKSGPFLQSQRRQRFLEFIVKETLAGRSERLKGYNIALEVFDRPETFDPVVDPIVRIEAGRLREKLRDYYEAEGQNDPIRIELPKGSYAPHIELRAGGNDRAWIDTARCVAAGSAARCRAGADCANGDADRTGARLAEAPHAMADSRDGRGADRGGRRAGAWLTRDHRPSAPEATAGAQAALEAPKARQSRSSRSST